jgi:hypothetical protein
MLPFPGFTVPNENPRTIVGVPNYSGENAYYGAVKLVTHEIPNYLIDVDRLLNKIAIESVLETMNSHGNKRKRTVMEDEFGNEINDTIEALESFIQYIDYFVQEISTLEYDPDDFTSSREYMRQLIHQEKITKDLIDVKYTLHKKIDFLKASKRGMEHLHMKQLTFGGKIQKKYKTRQTYKKRK